MSDDERNVPEQPMKGGAKTCPLKGTIQVQEPQISPVSGKITKMHLRIILPECHPSCAWWDAPRQDCGWMLLKAKAEQFLDQHT